MSSTTKAGRPPRVLTGRMVLFYLVAFFGVVFTMNFFMVRAAISSFSGVETESSYKAGLTFEKDVAAAHAQDALHWTVDAAVQHQEGNAAGVIVSAKDAQARPLTGLALDGLLAHPTDRRRDITLTFVETAPGQFRSLTPMPQGQWDLVIEFKRADEAVFRSKSRISL